MNYVFILPYFCCYERSCLEKKSDNFIKPGLFNILGRVSLKQPLYATYSKKELQVQVTVRSNFLVQVQNCEYFFIQALNLQKSLNNINMFCYYFFPG